MADVINPTVPAVVNPPESGQPVATETTTAVPYDRFKEVNDRMKAAEEKLRAAEADKTKAAEDELRRKGELKTLLDQRDNQLAVLVKEKEELALKAQKADDADKALREQTLAKITDANLKKIASELQTPSLLAFTEQLTTGKITPSGGKAVTTERPVFKNAQEMTEYLRKNNL